MIDSQPWEWEACYPRVTQFRDIVFHSELFSFVKPFGHLHSGWLQFEPGLTTVPLLSFWNHGYNPSLPHSSARTSRTSEEEHWASGDFQLSGIEPSEHPEAWSSPHTGFWLLYMMAFHPTWSWGPLSGLLDLASQDPPALLVLCNCSSLQC